MRRGPRKIIGYAVLVVAIAVVGVLAYREVKGTDTATAQSNTRTVAVSVGNVSTTVSATGNLSPVTTTDVSFATSGTLTEVDVKPGDTVTAGQVLAKIDPADAEKALTIAQLNYESAYQDYVNAVNGSTSTSASTSTGSGGGTQASTASSATSSVAKVNSAQVAMMNAQTSLDSAKKAAASTTLVAPVAGTVTTLNANAKVGNTVSGSSTGATASTGSASGSGSGGSATGTAGAGATGGASSSSSSSSSSAFVTIVDPTTFQVKVAFPEADAIKVKVSQVASITVDALPNTTLSGKVESIDPTATVTSNVVTYPAVISVANPPPTLRSGMTVSVTVTTQTKDGVVLVATAAVTTQGQTSTVMKVVNGTPTRTPVTIGLQGDSTTEITSGLAQGDQVVISTGSLTTSSAGSGNRTGTGGAGGLGGGGLGGGGQFPGAGGGPRPGG